MAVTRCPAPLGPVLRHLPCSLLPDIMVSSSLSLRYLGPVLFVTTMTESDGGKYKDEQDWLAQRFEENRTHLRAVAYRMLGSLSEADDAVQEAWPRLSRSDTSGIQNLGGWLTTVVGRVCLDMLRSHKSRREEHLEEPLATRVSEPTVGRDAVVDPEHESLLADSVGLVLLVVLETLSAAERLSFVLHDMFGVPYEEIAPIVSRSPNAAKMLASRARQREVVDAARTKETTVPAPAATAFHLIWPVTKACAAIDAWQGSQRVRVMLGARSDTEELLEGLVVLVGAD
jgi:RNA polymerase sigma factor (sigma-70 family)